MRSDNEAPGSAELMIKEAAARLLRGAADPDIPGLLIEGALSPVTRATLLPGTPLARTVDGLLRLAAIAEQSAELLRTHPDPAVRRACALLAARAHPLRTGLEVDPLSPSAQP